MDIETEDLAGKKPEGKRPSPTPATTKRQNVMHEKKMDKWQKEDGEKATHAEEIHYEPSPCTQERDPNQNIFLGDGNIKKFPQNDTTFKTKENQEVTSQLLDENFIGSREATIITHSAEKPYKSSIYSPTLPRLNHHTQTKKKNGKPAEPNPDKRIPFNPNNKPDNQPTPIADQYAGGCYPNLIQPNNVNSLHADPSTNPTASTHLTSASTPKAVQPNQWISVPRGESIPDGGDL